MSSKAEVVIRQTQLDMLRYLVTGLTSCVAVIGIGVATGRIRAVHGRSDHLFAALGPIYALSLAIGDRIGNRGHSQPAQGSRTHRFNPVNAKIIGWKVVLTFVAGVIGHRILRVSIKENLTLAAITFIADAIMHNLLSRLQAPIPLDAQATQAAEERAQAAESRSALLQAEVVTLTAKVNGLEETTRKAQEALDKVGAQMQYLQQAVADAETRTNAATEALTQATAAAQAKTAQAQAEEAQVQAVQASAAKTADAAQAFLEAANNQLPLLFKSPGDVFSFQPSIPCLLNVLSGRRGAKEEEKKERKESKESRSSRPSSGKGGKQIPSITQASVIKALKNMSNVPACVHDLEALRTFYSVSPEDAELLKPTNTLIQVLQVLQQLSPWKAGFAEDLLLSKWGDKLGKRALGVHAAAASTASHSLIGIIKKSSKSATKLEQIAGAIEKELPEICGRAVHGRFEAEHSSAGQEQFLQRFTSLVCYVEEQLMGQTEMGRAAAEASLRQVYGKNSEALYDFLGK